MVLINVDNAPQISQETDQLEGIDHLNETQRRPGPPPSTGARYPLLSVSRCKAISHMFSSISLHGQPHNRTPTTNLNRPCAVSVPGRSTDPASHPTGIGRVSDADCGGSRTSGTGTSKSLSLERKSGSLPGSSTSSPKRGSNTSP